MTPELTVRHEQPQVDRRGGWVDGVGGKVKGERVKAVPGGEGGVGLVRADVI